MPETESERLVSDDEPLLAAIKEFHERSDRGEEVDRDVFVTSHAQVRAGLKEYFRDLSLVEELAGPISATDTSVGGATVNSALALSSNEAPEDAAEASSPTATGPASDDSGTLAGDFPGYSPTEQATGIIPERFGRYRILKELGRGAMGAVYLAEDEQLQRKVALKVPKFPDGMNSELLERFYREARAAGNLRHPGICPVYDVGEINGQHFITMAYIEGQPLRRLTESGRPQDQAQAARIVQKIAQAMAVAHRQRVIHRDLKPANIMLDAEDQPVVMDFGLARRSADQDTRLTQSGMVIGSPAYMSPEQLDGDNDRVGPAADIYSLGVILYELLTGGLPYHGSLMSIVRQISMDPPRPIVELRGDIDPALEDLCLRMLAKRAKDRPESMAQVDQELSDWLAGRTLQGHEKETTRLPPDEADGSRERAASDGKRSSPGNRRMLIAGGLGAAVLTAAVVFLITIGGKYDVKITVEDPAIALKVDGDDVLIDGVGSQIRLSAGPHTLKMERDGLEAELEEFTVKKDGANAVHVAVNDGRFAVLRDGMKPPVHAAGNEPSANVWENIAAVRNDAATPAPPWTGEREFVLAFDGDGVVEVDSLHVDRTKPFTLEAAFTWRHAGETTHIAQFAGHLIQGRTDAVIDVWSESKVRFRLGQDIGVELGGVPQRPERVHLAAVYTGNELLGFRDGKLVDRSDTDRFKPEPVKTVFILGKNLVGPYEMFRLSSTARYEKEFEPSFRFSPDEHTVALYHFDEGQGDVLHDSSGNNHHGKIVGAKWVKAGGAPASDEASTASVQRKSLETSLYFARADDEVEIPTLKDDTDALTIELWLQRDSDYLLRGHSQIVSFDIHNGIMTNPQASLDFSMSGTRGTEGLGTAEKHKNGVDQPVHLAGVRDPAKQEIRFYVDGKLVGTKKGRIERGTGNLKICGNAYQWAPPDGGVIPFFHGWIDELSISKSVRYESEFTPQRHFTRGGETAALYHFDEGQSDVLHDSSGNDHHGIITGAKWVTIEQQHK